MIRTRTRLLVVGVLCAVVAGLAAAAAYGAFSTGPYEVQPSFEKDVNRDVPSVKSKSTAPRIVPAGASNVTTSTAGAVGFAGLAFPDQRSADSGNQFSLEPPDQGLCEGNGYVVEPVNDVVAIYSSGGAKQSGTESLTEFFTGQPQIVRHSDGSATYGPFLSDPRCYFDPGTQRFFMSILQISQDPTTGAFEGPSYEFLAASKSSTPSTDPNDWNIYKVDTTNSGGTADDFTGRTLASHPGCPCFGDQPLLGADAYGVYITTNEFSINGPEFNGAQIYAFDKADLVAGVPSPGFQAIEGAPIPLAEGPAYSLQPATSPSVGSWNTANGGTEYLMSALDFDATTDNRIAVWALTNTSSLDTTPAITLQSPAVVSSETYGQPPNAQQKNGPTPLADALGEGDKENQIATNDDRMNQVVYAAGKLWGGLNTVIRTTNGKSDQTYRAGIAYFIVSPSATSTSVSATVAKQGYIALGNNDNAMYPSIGVNADGQGVVAFSISGVHYYPSAAYAPINATSGVGDIHIAAAGVTAADGFTGYAAYGGDGVERWGDYSAAVAGDDGKIWIASEWIPGNFFPTYIASWGTYVNGVTP